MSETEDLKKVADRAYVEQRQRELAAYMDTLHNEIDVRIGEVRHTIIVMLSVFVGTTVMEFIIKDPRLILIDFAICLGVYVFVLYRERALQKKVGELKGALKVMKILGLIDFDWDDIMRKRRRSSTEMVSLVKQWLSEKKKMQDAAYAPA